MGTSGDVRIHERYDDETGENDIAVIMLRSRVPSSYTISMCKSTYSNYPIAVCGMGRINAKTGDHCKNLVEVQLEESVSGRGCYDMKSTKTEICLLGRNKDSCNGDSGGPAYPLDPQTGEPICLYGVVSYGSEECDGWGVYTRMSYYRNWVKQFM